MGSAVTESVAYFDTNVFITAFENAGARSDHAWWILDAVETGELKAVTSEITLAEILVKPIELGADDLCSAYEQVFVSGPNFEVCPVERRILIEAARIRAGRKSIRLPDAVHIATAARRGCTYFLSGDTRLRLPQDMKQVFLGPFTLDDIVNSQG